MKVNIKSLSHIAFKWLKYYYTIDFVAMQINILFIAGIMFILTYAFAKWNIGILCISQIINLWIALVIYYYYVIVYFYEFLYDTRIVIIYFDISC